MFKIAATLGRTVAELEPSLTHFEFLEWIGYFEHMRALESGKGPAEIIHIEDVETRSRLIEQSLFGSCL